MKLAFVRPKEVIDVVAGLIGLLFDQFDGEMPIEVEAQGEPEVKVQGEPELVANDLTRISGIGPAIARRLAEAGVSTYAQLARMTPLEVRQRARLATWQGNPEDWISQAVALSSS